MTPEIRPNLFSRSIFSLQKIKAPPEFDFPGFTDLVISFYTIFTVIMQEQRINDITRTIPQVNALLFIYSITFSASTLLIARRALQLSDYIKSRIQYRVMFVAMVFVLAYFVFLLLVLIPYWENLKVEDIEVAKYLLVALSVPNSLLLFFHTWLWFAFNDFYSRRWQALLSETSFNKVILVMPYVSYILNIILAFKYV